ncbi:MAG: hypothetical protein ACRDOO_18905 [Actinomadura sp.]
MAELTERVTILETQMRGLSDEVARVRFTADTCMGRMDFLAENLTEVRRTVTRIEQVHGEQLREHGELLRQILAKLN